MSQPDIPNSQSHVQAPEAVPAEAEPRAHESQATTTTTADAAPPAQSASDANASAHENGAHDESAHDEGGAEEEEHGSTEGGETATAEGAPQPGTPGKRKRRRRRKKKPHGEAGAEGAPAEGASAEGGPKPEGAPGGKPNRPKKDRPERERPAFNVGDVVFGKVIEFTDDALFVDLAGKAKAIFDLRELLITEDEAEEYNRAHKADRAEAGAESTKDVAAAETHAEQTAGETPAEQGEAPALEAAATATESTEAAPQEAPAAEPAHAVEGAAVSASATQGSEGRTPQLPRVILEPGAPFVGLVHNDGGRGGLVVLTHHPKRLSKAKPILAEASKTSTLVFGLVTGVIKGGVEIDVDGLRAFAPASHVDLRPGADLSHLVGKRLAFAVTQYAKRGRDVVLSRRSLLEVEAKAKREEALKKLEIGAVVDGVVRTVVPFGAFVDVGGVEGLVPLSEMSHNRADGPRDVFKVNETVQVKILRVDEKGKLWLSRKAAVADPWAEVAGKYAQGSKHMGKVARLQPFGAFIELEPGIDGLIHTADLSVKRLEHPEEVLKVGEQLEVMVAHVDAKQHRIALHPAPTGEAANELPQRIQLHKIVKVVVVAVESGGLAVRVLGATGRNARGFISAAATGTPRGTELRKLFPVGKELEVKIVEHDPRRGELKLSIKALNEETERNAYQQYRAQVKREAKFGTFADLLAKRNVTPSK